MNRMSGSDHRRGQRSLWLLLLIALMFITPSVSASRNSACISPKRTEISQGPSPSGQPWRVRASVRDNGSRCDEWLFQVQFQFPNGKSWAAGMAIPPRGHTSRYFWLSALDLKEIEAGESVFSGLTNRETALLVATLEDGSRREVRPRVPPAELRRTRVWLRSFRFFVWYHPPQHRVEAVSLFSRGGRLLYRARGHAGVF
jgi:hypothetical protein